MCCYEKRHKNSARCSQTVFQKISFESNCSRVVPKLFFPILILPIKTRKSTVFLSNTVLFYGCGGRTRTYDLRVMSPTSFQLLYSAMFIALS